MSEIRVDNIKLRDLLWKRQVKIARKAGLHPDTLQKKLKNQRPWTIDDLNKVASAGGFSVCEFVEIEGLKPI